MCTLISYDYDRVCQNKQSLRKYVELSTRFNDLMIFNERFLERARVSVQIPAVLRWARAFCLGGVGSPCRGKLWQTLLSLRTTCATTRDFLPIASFRKKKHKKALHLFLILHVLWPLSNLMFMQCMAFDPSDVHCCPGDEVLQRHGSKAEGPKTALYISAFCDVRARHLPSVSIPFLCTSTSPQMMQWNCSKNIHQLDHLVQSWHGSKKEGLSFLDYSWMCCEAVYFVEACGSQRGLTESTLEVFANECRAQHRA